MQKIDQTANRPAVFLDRDGTIIRRVDVLTDPSMVVLLPGAAGAIADLNRRRFLVISVTNQPIVEKGLLTQAGLDRIHAELARQLAVIGARLDAIYTCPHKYRPPEDPIPQCSCRKPGIKLIEDARADFPIDMEHSWFIGDRLRDVATGIRAGLRTILVATGGESDDDSFFSDAAPIFFAEDLDEAIKLVQ